MKLLITMVLGLVAVLTLDGQVTTVIPLSAGSYAVTFPSGKVSLVTVQSMGGDFYSLWDGSHLVQVHVAALSANTYYLTDTSGQSMTVTMLPSSQHEVPVPAPAQPNYTIPQQPPANLVDMYAEMVAICNSRGGIIYKGKCLNPTQADQAAAIDQLQENAKAAQKALHKREQFAAKCAKRGGTFKDDVVWICEKNGVVINR